MVSTIRPNGELRSAPPGSFGAVTNAHHIKVGGPWDSTFEPLFNTADGEMNDVIDWLFTLECSRADSSGPRLDRILAQPCPPERQLQLARTLGSLIARSPRTRSEIRLTNEHFRGRFGISAPPEEHLISMNQRGLYHAYCKLMEQRGRWAVLFSDAKEFIFGDGFLHDFPASADGLNFAKRCILPLTPTVAIVYMLPMQHPSEPKLVTIRVDTAEVQFLNDALQAYAKEFLFFRSQRPVLIPAFTDGSHRQFKYHKHEWLEGFLDDLSQYNLWGPGGTPSRSEGYFLNSFLEGQRFDAMIEGIGRNEWQNPAVAGERSCL